MASSEELNQIESQLFQAPGSVKRRMKRLSSVMI
jgi:hypothetical protein